jgi:hypothetical protein
VTAASRCHAGQVPDDFAEVNLTFWLAEHKDDHTLLNVTNTVCCWPAMRTPWHACARHLN